MKVEVATAIEELKLQFPQAGMEVQEDGQGGAYVFLDPMPLGAKYRPDATWIGFQIPAQYPYADIYPVFIGGDVVRADGAALVAPVTPGHSFQGRNAIQISRRSAAAQSGSQKATSKVLKILSFLEDLR